MRYIALACALTACHPVIAVGYDARSVKKGPLAELAGQRMGDAVARQTATTASSTQAVDDADSYSVSVGGGARDFTISGALIANDVSKSTFATGADTPRFASGTAGVDVAWTWLRWKAFATQLHAGPMTTLLVDRGTGDRSWANGLRYGAGAELEVKGLALFADFHRDVVAFGSGPAEGTSQVTGITFGVAFHP